MKRNKMLCDCEGFFGIKRINGVVSFHIKEEMKGKGQKSKIE